MCDINDVREYDRCSGIAECAYYKTQVQSFGSGYEIQDWLNAKAKLDE